MVKSAEEIIVISLALLLFICFYIQMVVITMNILFACKGKGWKADLAPWHHTCLLGRQRADTRVYLKANGCRALAGRLLI